MPTIIEDYVNHTRCKVCNRDFDDDPSDIPRHNRDLSHLPIQSSQCSHIVCHVCLTREKKSLFVQSPATAEDDKIDWLHCPLCKKEKCFNLKDPIISTFLCDIMKRERAVRKRVKTDLIAAKVDNDSTSSSIRSARNAVKRPLPQSVKNRADLKEKKVLEVTDDEIYLSISPRGQTSNTRTTNKNATSSERLSPSGYSKENNSLILDLSIVKKTDESLEIEAVPEFWKNKNLCNASSMVVKLYDIDDASKSSTELELSTSSKSSPTRTQKRPRPKTKSKEVKKKSLGPLAMHTSGKPRPKTKSKEVKKKSLGPLVMHTSGKQHNHKSEKVITKSKSKNNEKDLGTIQTISFKIDAERKKSFREVGFAKWRKQWLPMIELGPFDVPPGPIRSSWFSYNATNSKARLVYWYTSSKTDLSQAFTFLFRPLQIITYDEGVKRGLHRIPVSLSNKIEEGKELNRHEKELVSALYDIEREHKKEKKNRVAWIKSFCD